MSASLNSRQKSNSLLEKADEIDNKMTNSKNLVYFAANKYDFHHKNDEMDIINEKSKNLKLIEKNCTIYQKEYQSFDETLKYVEQTCNDIDEDVERLIAICKEHFLTIQEDENKVQEDENKENTNSENYDQSESF